MTIPSSTKVAKVLTENGYEYTPNEVRNSCEAYGPKVFAYLLPPANKTLDDLKALLRKANIGYSANYSGLTAEIRVSYFKAHHWDE